jgi:NAD(P)-dependent dehydrogenase (short-subunit alcohol dehydrogenase family)
MQISLKGKVVFVTGGARGIGRGIVLEMARAGAEVVILDILRELGEETVEIMTREGLRGYYEYFDVTECEAFEKILEKYPNVEIIVNNAGVTPEEDFLQTSEERLREVFEINFFGGYMLSKKFAEQMICKHKTGSILFTGSTHQKITMLRPAYSCSKAALGMLVKELALELSPKYGIRVNAVAPGVVAIHGEDDLSEEVVPIGLKAVPEDIGKAMVFLASDAAAHITGQTLVVDGGFSIAHRHFWSKQKREGY